MSAVRGCLAQIGCLTLVVGVGTTAWLVRRPAWAAVQRWIGEPPASSAVVVWVAPEMADSAEAKVGSLRPGDEVSLTLSEVQSWVTYRVEPVLPKYIHDVRLAFLESALRLDARVETRRIPGVETVTPIADLVGDTAELSLIGRLDGIGAGRGALFVDRVFVAGIPLPDPVRDRLLASLRPKGEEAPAHAVAFPLPPPAWDVAIREGSLILRGGIAPP